MDPHMFIIRHAERIDQADPNWKEPGIYRSDPPITKQGVEDAKCLARLLKSRVRHIFSSPFHRTLQTAEILAAELDVPVKVEWGICEWLGSKLFSESPILRCTVDPLDLTLAAFPHAILDRDSLVRPSFPEERSACKSRASAVAQHLAERFSVGGGESIALVTHAATMKDLTRALVHPPVAFPKPQRNSCRYNTLIWTRSDWRADTLNNEVHCT